MKKYKLLTAIGALCLILASCGQNSGDDIRVENTPPAVETESPAPTPFPGMTNTPGASASPSPTYIPVPDSGYVFDITEDEKVIYERLKSELSSDVFEGADPHSIAKIFIKAGIDAEWEAEYACYSDQYLGTTKEEYHQIHLNDISLFDVKTRQDVANWLFPLIDEGEFIENGDKGYISFYSIPDEEQGVKEEDTYAEFHFIKNEKGIWEVRYNPTIADMYEE